MALADLDNDGDQDVIINNLNQAAGLYRNESSKPRVAVRLRGRGGNRFGVGARVRLANGNSIASQEIMAGGRYLSGDDPLRVFAMIPGRAYRLRCVGAAVRGRCWRRCGPTGFTRFTSRRARSSSPFRRQLSRRFLRMSARGWAIGTSSRRSMILSTTHCCRAAPAKRGRAWRGWTPTAMAGRTWPSLRKRDSNFLATRLGASIDGRFVGRGSCLGQPA